MTVPWKYGTQDAQAYADHVAECRVEECVICAGVKPVSALCGDPDCLCY